MRRTEVFQNRRTRPWRWRRERPSVSDATECERLTQQRLYGERRSVDRLEAQHSQPRERT